MKTFPGVYATKVYKPNDQRYLFIHSDDPSEPRKVRLIGQALQSYVRLSPLLRPQHHPRCPELSDLAALHRGTVQPRHTVQNARETSRGLREGEGAGDEFR